MGDYFGLYLIWRWRRERNTTFQNYCQAYSAHRKTPRTEWMAMSIGRGRPIFHGPISTNNDVLSSGNISSLQCVATTTKTSTITSEDLYCAVAGTCVELDFNFCIHREILLVILFVTDDDIAALSLKWIHGVAWWWICIVLSPSDLGEKALSSVKWHGHLITVTAATFVEENHQKYITSSLWKVLTNKETDQATTSAAANVVWLRLRLAAYHLGLGRNYKLSIYCMRTKVHIHMSSPINFLSIERIADMVDTGRSVH